MAQCTHCMAFDLLWWIENSWTGLPRAMMSTRAEQSMGALPAWPGLPHAHPVAFATTGTTLQKPKSPAGQFSPLPPPVGVPAQMATTLGSYQLVVWLWHWTGI